MGRVRAVPALILGLLLACGPDGPDLEAALAAVRSGNDAALKLELDKATDPLARDMMLLELATAEPTAGESSAPP